MALARQQEAPGEAAAGGRQRQPQPAAQARQRIGGDRDRREVEDDRPRRGMIGGNEQRRDLGADKAEAGERRPVQRGERQRRQSHGAEREERRARADESVERVRGVDAAEGGDDAGAGQRRRRVGARRGAAERRKRAFGAAQPFAEAEQDGGERQAEQHARAGAEIALLGGVADEQQRAEASRDPANPDSPARAEPFFKRSARGRRARRRLRRFGGGHSLGQGRRLGRRGRHWRRRDGNWRGQVGGRRRDRRRRRGEVFGQRGCCACRRRRIRRRVALAPSCGPAPDASRRSVSDQPLADVVERPFDVPDASPVAHGGEKADRSEDDGGQHGEPRAGPEDHPSTLPPQRARRRRASVRRTTDFTVRDAVFDDGL